MGEKKRKDDIEKLNMGKEHNDYNGLNFIVYLLVIIISFTLTFLLLQELK